MLIAIGTKIGGRYKVLGLIGRGGMANVYLARDLILDRDVAVKILRFDFQSNKEALRRFKREALSTTQLIHPNIVSVYDVDEDDGLQYIVMEYIQGRDLKKFIQEKGQLSLEDVIHIMSQILSAMALAHQNRIIHRDIKPQNLLIDSDNVIKVTDFGIAIALSETSLTQTNSLLGSVHYMSPEQARGSIPTIKSDIYALGIVLYELVTGKVPFDGESAVSIALKHFQEPIPSVRAERPEIPQALENVILKATAKEPHDRYNSCEEMSQDLQTSLDANRLQEAAFTPEVMLDETKVITPVKLEENDLPKTENTDQVTDVRKSQKKPRKKRIVWGILLILLLIVTGGSLAAMVANNNPDSIAVPNVLGVKEEKAREMLLEANFTIGEVYMQYHEDAEEGSVFKVDPEVNTQLAPKTAINLYISQGVEPFLIEDYSGQPYSDVRKELVKKGIQVEREDVYDSLDAGLIVGQSLEPDTEVIPDETTITLLVSLGPETFTMENLSGYTREEVERYAENYGLKLTIKTQKSEEVAEGLVLSQSIAAESNFYSGDSLEVIISEGVPQTSTETEKPKPEKPESQATESSSESKTEEPDIITFTKKITIPYLPPEENSSETDSESDSPDVDNEEELKASNHIIIYMLDSDHQLTEVFREFDITEDKEVNLNFRIYSDQSGAFIVERDGINIMEETNLID